MTIKKTSLALALVIATGAASAQSQVTLFGVADAAVRRAETKGVGHLSTLASGSFSSSRWGLRGQEDLGNGLSASFWLESFLSTDTGLATPAGFQRRSTVSLSSRDLGELRLGRDYTPTHSNWARFDPFGYVGVGAVQLLVLSATGQTPVTAAFGSNPNTVQRANNGIQWQMPRNPLGLEGAVVVNAGEGGTAAGDQHKSKGARLGWSNGPFVISAATMRTRNNLTVGDFVDTALAGSYSIGGLRVSAGTRTLKYQAAKQANYLVGVVYRVGAQDFKFSWNRADFDGRVGTTNISANRADQLALGWVYSFSKSMRVYATASSIDNAGASRFVVPGAPAGTAGAKSRALEMGMNKDF